MKESLLLKTFIEKTSDLLNVDRQNAFKSIEEAGSLKAIEDFLHNDRDEKKSLLFSNENGGLKLILPKREKLQGNVLVYLRRLPGQILNNTDFDSLICFTCNFDGSLKTLNFVQLLRSVYAKISPQKPTLAFQENLLDFISSIELATFEASINIDFSVEPEEELVDSITSEDRVDYIKKVLERWVNVLNKFLIESNQVRSESDESGPSAETVYWQKKLLKLSTIHECLKNENVARVLKVMKKTNSSVLSKFIIAERQLICEENQAKTNAQFTDKLMQGEFQSELPAIFNCLKMIYNFNSDEGSSKFLTTLLVRITNVIVKSCQLHLMKNTDSIWSLNTTELLKRIEKVDHFTNAYHHDFLLMKKDLTFAEHCVVDFSENRIFSKLHSFKGTILTEGILRILGVFKEINKISVICEEGCVSVHKKMLLSKDKLLERPLDLRDNVSMEQFNTLKETFLMEYSRQKGNLGIGLLEWFNKSKLFWTKVRIIEKCQDLNIEEFQIEQRYLDLFQVYLSEIESWKATFQSNYKNPEISRGMPSRSGRIQWSRDIFRKLEEGISLFKEKCPILLENSDGRHVIREYNGLASILVKYELFIYQDWLRNLPNIQESMNTPIIVHEECGDFKINFNKQICVSLLEVKYMQKYGFEIPQEIIGISRVYEKLNKDRLCVEDFLRKYHLDKKKIPESLETILYPFIGKLNLALKEELTLRTWTSITIQDAIARLFTRLDSFNSLVKTASDIFIYRVEDNITRIRQLSLITLEENTKMSKDSSDFYSMIHEIDKIFASNKERLLALSGTIEEALNDLLQTLSDALSKEHGDVERHIIPGKSYTCMNQVKASRCEKCLACAFNQFMNGHCQKSTKAVIRALRNSLETVRGLFSPVTTMFNVRLEVIQSRVDVNPSMNHLQSIIGKLCDRIIGVADHFPQWNHVQMMKDNIKRDNQGQDVSSSGSNSLVMISLLRPVSKQIAENKEIPRIMGNINARLLEIQGHMNETLGDFHVFSELLPSTDVNYQRNIEEFVAQMPKASELDQKLKDLQEMSQKIEDLCGQNIEVAGTFSVSTVDVKMDLELRLEKYRIDLCDQITLGLLPFIEEKLVKFDDFLSRFTRPVRDLDDVRYHMKTLEEWREFEVIVDLQVEPIQSIFSIIQRYHVKISNGSLEKIDSFEYILKKISLKANEVMGEIDRVHITFRDEVIENTIRIKDNFEAFNRDYNENGPKVKGISPREASDRLFIFQASFDDIWTRYTNLVDAQSLFGMQVSNYPELTVIKKDLGLLQKLYQLYNTVIEVVNSFYEIPWAKLDINVILQRLSDFQASCRKLPKALKTWQAFTDLCRKIDDFSESCPILEMMTSPALIDRHWDRISDLVKRKINVNLEGFLLRHMMEIPLLQHKDEIEDICISATKEKEIESKLKRVIDDWMIQEFQLAPFKGKANILIKGSSTLDSITLIEDSMMVLSSLLSNRYNQPYKARIQDWIQKLSMTGEILEQWLNVQNMWIYLEAVFVGGDISRQLPQEAKRFGNIDKSWQRIMRRAKEIPSIIQCCTSDDSLVQILPNLIEQLEVCKKSLSGYLENKRLIFPRFFFVSDPVLLEILGQGSDSHSIQGHLLSLFDNVDRVTFDSNVYDRIIQITSREGETLDLCQAVMAQGSVEHWLGDLLKGVLNCVRDQLSKAYDLSTEKDFDLIEAMDQMPAQIGLLCLQLQWTAQSHNALENSRFNRRILQATNLRFLNILNQLIGVTLRDLTKYQRTKYETLITIHVHQKDIFEELTLQNIRSPKEFEWLKQTRFYYLPTEEQCQISICDYNCHYQNEFLGCNERLVITPLTDKCYITISQALNLSLGAAPAGPAGTGKTETVKDMGRCLGKYVVVFNCSDQLDYRGLGRLYKGLAQSGAWGCFDEFNRIDLPVLSVAAQQIEIVLSCKKRKKAQFIFTDGDRVPMNPEFGIFITMNPGYAGRQELPENLKINFRTVAMMVPDRGIIMRVKMASCGFLRNTELALKFFTLYKLCDEQLSKQVHYDFGLRNILSVLRTLGNVKRRNPDDSEAMIVMQVLKDMNMSKLVEEDEPLFMSLLQDLFPNQNLKRKGYPLVEAAIKAKIEESPYVTSPAWFTKIIQLYETQLVRHGIMLLGPSGSGKTSCIDIMLKSLSNETTTYRELRMNPKAITSSQMFGRLDVATNDWTDGIFSTLWRRTHKLKANEFVWLILDGPVDAIWIENLNSVLDDNKTLTLANGDRIPMGANVKIVFEVHNIDNASPATVSRNGMIFMSSSVISWEQYLEAWLKNLTSSRVIDKTFVANCLRRFYPEVLKFSTTSFDHKMELLSINYIKQTLDIFHGLIGDFSHGSLDEASTERLILFSISWAFSSVIEEGDRNKLAQFISMKSQRIDLPGDGNIFDYFISETDGQWKPWSTITPDYEYPQDHNNARPEMTEILVPNIDNTRINYLLRTIARQGKPVLLLGESGTGKSAILREYLKGLNPETDSSALVNFSSVTTPEMFQRTVESYLEKRMGLTHGPIGGKKMTMFIDDISMPVVNEWGDQITNELTRQLIEMQGFYSLTKPGDFHRIDDISIVSAMFYPGGSRNEIPERLKRQFTIFNVTQPTSTSLERIFSTFARGHFSQASGFHDEEIINLAMRLVPATIQLWRNVKETFLPTPAKFHYIFSLRDLSKIWQGLLKACSLGVTTCDELVYLWQNEAIRVLADKLILPSDTEKFYLCLSRQVSESFNASLFYSQEREEQDPLFFVNFMRDAEEPDGDEALTDGEVTIEQPNIYERTNEKSLLARLQMFINSYNEQSRDAKLALVFFKDALRHFVRISRILSSSKGHALLVGVGGSGKQSLTRIAAHVCNSRLYQLSITRTYNLNNFLDDIRSIYRIAGQQGKSVTLLLTENDIKDENFLEYVNNILSGSEIANLFTRDEMSEIYQDLHGPFKKEHPRCPMTTEALSDFYHLRITRNLHLSLCFSPVGERFRSRLLKFPGIISGCTINWFHPLPTEALIEVSRVHMAQRPDVGLGVEATERLVTSMGHYHERIAGFCGDYFEKYRRRTHVTLKSFLSFLEAYCRVYREKFLEIKTQDNRLVTGLTKLEEASEKIAVLSEELVVKEKDLIIANERAGQVLQRVTNKAESAQEVKKQVEAVKTKAQVLVDKITREKEEAETKLEAAKPALLEAEAALATIKPNHISTVRKLGRPPHLIMRIMDCVLILFQKKLDTVEPDAEKPCCRPSWGESLKLMGNQGFLPGLLNFPKDSINDEMIDLMEPYFAMDDFSFESAKRVCGDVAGLFSWTKAMAAFYAVNKEVLPLKANLAVQENLLAKANRELADAEFELAEKQGELDAVQGEYDTALDGKNALIRDADSCKRKMDNATTLIESLRGEKDRWIEKSLRYQEQIELLIGDAFFASSFLTYLGPFNQTFRSLLLEETITLLDESKIPYSKEIDLIKFLIESPTLAQWTSEGLPNDELSMQNGSLVTKSIRYPLLIDPQLQGRTWIKRKETDLIVTTQNDKYFRSHVEDAISMGRPLLIQDIEESIDPVLDNVLERNFIKTGTKLKVYLGDKEILIGGDGFRVYLTTKMSNPSYTPEVYARTSIIDFTVTPKGLEDQLLGRVIKTEREELETSKRRLVEEISTSNNTLANLENSILVRMNETKGSLVDDDDLVELLQKTRKIAREVSEKLKIASQTEVEINRAREEYRPVANRGSLIYFLIVEIAQINVMYQTSLRQFLAIFDYAMARSELSPSSVQKRSKNIIDLLTMRAFVYISRGLYEIDKRIFSLLLALKIGLESKIIRYEDFQYLLKAGDAFDVKEAEVKSKLWISDEIWLNLNQLAKLPAFTTILESVNKFERGWKKWYESENPEEDHLPERYDKMTAFQRLLLIRCWCLDRFLHMTRRFIQECLGIEYGEPVVTNLKVLQDEEDWRTPLVCLLSMGSDPTENIESLAKNLGKKFFAISMGQGQEVPARHLLETGLSDGYWVLLQNCHLGPDFMEEVTDKMMKISDKPEGVNENFRLWITTEANNKFPIGLLQMSTRFTFDPPIGVRAGIRRTYGMLKQDQIDQCNHPNWKVILYTLAFMHTSIQERRKFGSIGWNIPYEFNQSDFSASMAFLMNHLDGYDKRRQISWPTIRYMIGEVHYGGRVTDNFDKRLLNTFTEVWFSDRIFEDTFEFSKGYGILRGKSLEEMCQKIEEQLPGVDSPECFALNKSADASYQVETARTVIKTIADIQPKSSSGEAGESREALLYRLADDLLARLPPDYLPSEVKARLAEMDALRPVHIFLRQEIDKLQTVLTRVKSNLNDLKLAIDGTLVMSEVLQEILESLFQARVPRTWLKISWPSPSLTFWFGDLVERNRQLNGWLNNSSSPSSFWLAGFFNPQGFVTAVKQEAARAHKLPLNDMILRNEVTKMMNVSEVKLAPREGIYLNGLSICGAEWDRKNLRLTEATSKAVAMQIPIIYLVAKPIQNPGGGGGQQKRIDQGAGRKHQSYEYSCPVYKCPARTDANYIMSLDLATNTETSHWILRGVALLCDAK